jgi:pectin methylesterase-like acyl-CoA thioesterase
MARISLLRLISVLALAAGDLSASTITYEVGTCMPGLPSFPTITAALAATPAANIVMVCPGTYREQVQITQPVTLEGVSTDDSARAIIAAPVGGLATNATDDFGFAVAAQLWVNNVSGPVNISDLTVDASKHGVPSGPTFVVGIFYQNSSGTVNRAREKSRIAAFRGIV